MIPGQFKYLKMLVPDPYDCILSKLERNSAKDRDDADYLFRSQKLTLRYCATDMRTNYDTTSSETWSGTKDLRALARDLRISTVMHFMKRGSPSNEVAPTYSNAW